MSENKDFETNTDAGFMFGFSVILFLLVLLTILIVVIARVVGPTHTPRDEQFVDMEHVTKNIKPVGEVLIEGEAVGEGTEGAASSAAPAVALWLEGSLDPQALYDSSCKLCHSGKLPNVPQIGVAKDWTARIAKGKEVLYTNSISGINAMPARGASTMSDEQLKVVVDYMIAASR